MQPSLANRARYPPLCPERQRSLILSATSRHSKENPALGRVNPCGLAQGGKARSAEELALRAYAQSLGARITHARRYWGLGSPWIPARPRPALCLPVRAVRSQSTAGPAPGQFESRGQSMGSPVGFCLISERRLSTFIKPGFETTQGSQTLASCSLRVLQMVPLEVRSALRS